MNIAILGTGALGIALAKTLYKEKQTRIVMWTKFEEERDLVSKTRANEKLLPGVYLPDDIEITSDLAYATKDTTVILNCLPFIAVENVAEELKNVYNNQYICSTTKGIDMTTFETTTEIFSRVLNTDKICALSGPSFAIEIANGYPISFVLAGQDKTTVDEIYNLISSENIYIDKSSDPIGVQLCGAIKNAIAVGSGMLHGLESSDSTQAAYLTRGINDMYKIISSLGGNSETISTYAGIGDLILTCFSEKSRNFSCGKLLGQGYTLEESIAKLNGKTVEGIKIIESLYNYTIKEKLDLDIIPKLYNIVFNLENAKTLERK